MTHLIDEPCACGLFARRIAKIHGRADEMVVCGMGNVGPWVFDEVLRGIPAADEWQAVLTSDGRYDVIELRVESDAAASALAEIVRAHLRERFPDFWKNREMGLYTLRVTPVPCGSLRTGRKLRRIIDER